MAQIAELLPPPVTERRLVRRTEAIRRLGIGRQKWHELVSAKKIPVVKIGERVFIRSDLLDQIVEDPSVLATTGAPQS